MNSFTTTTEFVTPPIASNQTEKLSGHEFFKSIGSPKYVVAPMVDQSELAWRILSRLHGATLAYTPMFHAGLFSSSTQPKYAQESFDTSPDSLEGKAPYDRPLVVQFCANDKELWLKAAEKVVGRCDAVDLNLGCPQGIAKKGHYGAFLMDEWELVGSMISHLHAHLTTLPVIAKIRVFPDLSKTLSYASHVFSAGAQLLTVHGRTREMKGQLAGLADWTKIQAITSLLGTKIPILANGGLPSGLEIENCLEETGANGVMSAEGNLYNPMIFSPFNALGGREYKKGLPLKMIEALNECDSELVGTWDENNAAYAPATYLASQYLAIVETLPSTETGGSAVKSHLFKLFRPIWAEGRHIDLREKLGSSGTPNFTAAGKSTRKERLLKIKNVVEEFRKRILADTEAGHLPPNTNRPLTQLEVETDYGGIIPYSHAQPYFRIATIDSAPTTVIENTEVVVVLSEEVLSNKRAHSPTLTDNPTLPSISTSASVSNSSVLPLPSETKKLKKATGTTTESEMTTIPCIRSTFAPPHNCINASSAKCTHRACSSCCIIISSNSTNVELNDDNDDGVESNLQQQQQKTGTESLACFFHLEKQRKEKEKNLMKKNQAREKKRLHKERNEKSSSAAEKLRLEKKVESEVPHLERRVETDRLLLLEKVQVEEGGEKVEVEI